MLRIQLQANNDFFEDLISHIQLAQTRIYLQAMIWFPEDIVYRLLLELEKAKERNPNLDIQISYDKLSEKYLLSERKEGRMSYSKTMKEFLESFAPNIQKNILDTFGLGYHLSGRDHKKIYIIDNVFWLGGCNMHYGGVYDQLDFMVRFEGENALTDAFVDTFQRSLDRSKFEKKDREFELENIPNFKFLIDSGKPGKSIIQQNFLNIITSAQKEILISTQYYPTGNILKTIQKLAKQGKDSADIYLQQNRQDLADAELAQVKVIESYLPKQLSAEELEAALKEIIAEVGATDAKDMGKVMGVASKKLAGIAEGRAISAKVKELLG